MDLLAVLMERKFELNSHEVVGTTKGVISSFHATG